MSSTRSLGIIALLAIALLIALITYGAGGTVIKQEAEQRDVETSKDALNTVLKLQLDEETGIRGYAATGQLLFLQPYDAALSTFDAQLDSLLRTLTAAGLASQAAHVRELRAINARWLARVGRPIARGQIRGSDVRTQQAGKGMVDAFRATQSSIADAVASRSAAIDQRARQTIQWLAASGLTLSLLIGALVVAIFRRAIESEHAALRAVEAQTRREGVREMAEAIPQLVWALDPGGERITYVNDAWIAYTGMAAEETSNGGWLDPVHPADRAVTQERWRHAIERTLPYETEYRLRSREGEYRWFLVRATPIFDESKRLTQWLSTSTDIDRQKLAEERLREAFEREQHASLAFQEAALPRFVPQIPGFTFDAVYRAAGNDIRVGGDWYDVFRLVDGRIVVTIGDVLGSGIDAAVTMNAIRNALRGAAQIFPEPVAMLDAAERTLEAGRHENMVTAFIGIIDPVTMSIAHANAGHPMPLLRNADGTVRSIDGETGPPLGVRTYARLSDGTRTMDLPEPSTIVLYTDGLIEAGRDVVAGHDALVEALADRATVESPSVASALLERLIDHPSHDDVAILAVRIESPSEQVRRIGGHLHEQWQVNAADVAAVRSARGEFAETLREHGLHDDDIVTGELVFTELIGNVFRHGGTWAQIRVDLSHPKPVLHVLDRGRGFAYSPMLPLDMMSESGRGLFIISQLTDSFTVVPRPSGGSHARAVLSMHAANAGDLIAR